MAKQATELLEIRYLPVDALVPFAQNARTHSEQQIREIAASIQEFGWTNPILMDGAKGVIAGHGRILAAKRLAMKQVPCIELAHLSEPQKRAYIIADNKLAENAGWNKDLLRVELGDLKLAGFDLSLTGFSGIEIDKLFATGNDGNTDPDALPDPPPSPVTKPGDVWILGRHRLVCGDATTATDVAKALCAVKPHLMVTDPPYGVDYKPERRAKEFGDKIARSTGRVQNDGRADWREAWALFPGDIAYVWHAMQTAGDVWSSLDAVEFEVKTEIVWKKPHYVLSHSRMYHPQHESCYYAARKGRKQHWQGDTKQSTIWEIDNGTFQGGKPGAEDGKTGHGTQKPVELFRRAMENSSSPGQAVYDPFCGSGTSIIAGEQTGRAVHALEIDPGYVDLAVIRWQAFAGQSAKLEGPGDLSFAIVATQRGVDTADRLVAQPRKKRGGGRKP